MRQISEDFAMLRIGLISDTHGLLRPAAMEFLRGCDRIVHGGDIHKPGVLEVLAQMSPVIAVRGNNDKGDWADDLPETELVRFEEKLVYVIHDISRIDIDPGTAQVDVVVFGHSHQPSIEERKGVLYINPGSAGPKRFKLPVSVGELLINGDSIASRIVQLDSETWRAR
jgi:putative phosphoesterase